MLAEAKLKACRRQNESSCGAPVARCVAWVGPSCHDGGIQVLTLLVCAHGMARIHGLTRRGDGWQPVCSRCSAWTSLPCPERSSRLGKLLKGTRVSWRCSRDSSVPDGQRRGHRATDSQHWLAIDLDNERLIDSSAANTMLTRDRRKPFAAQGENEIDRKYGRRRCRQPVALQRAQRLPQRRSSARTQTASWCYCPRGDRICPR